MKKGKTILMILSWIAVFAALSFFMKPTKNTNAIAQKGSLLVTGRSGYALTVEYKKLTGLEYRETMDYGSLLEGTDDQLERSGRWENAELGEYILCVNPKIEPCILARTEEGTMVFNFESGKATEALYTALTEQMEAQPVMEGEGKMLSVSTRGFVDVDGVKLSEIAIHYDTDMSGAAIDSETYALTVYTGSILENFGGGSIGDVTGVRVDGSTVTLSLYTDYHLASETPFASALAVSVTQKKDISTNSRTIPASEAAVDNYAAAEAGGQGPRGGPGGMRGGSGGMRGGKSASIGSYTIDGIDGFRYFTNNTDYGTPDGAPFHKDHCFSEITGEYSDVDVSYALFVPENYDPAKQYALVTVQNPAAMEGTHPIASVLETRGPAVFASDWAQQFVRDQHPELDGLIVVVPTVTERVNDNGGTPAQYEAIVALWDSLIETYSIDPNYIYGTGQSVGGMIVAETNRNRDNFFAGIWLFEDQWGQNYTKEAVFARGMRSDGYQETAQNTPRHYYRTDAAITWDYTLNSQGGKDYEDWDPYNYLYLISDDNILITNRTDNLLSNNTWQELAYLYKDTVGFTLSHFVVDAKAPRSEQTATIRAFLDKPDMFNGQSMGIRWLSFEHGSNGYSCRRTDAGYEWLLSQSRQTAIAREKLDLNKPFEPAAEQDRSPERILPGYVDAQTGEPIYYKTAKAGSGTALYNTCLLILGNDDKARADANPGWLPEGMDYPLSAAHIVCVTPVTENGALRAVAVEYDADLTGLVMPLKGEAVMNSRGERYDDYFVTMEPFQLFDPDGAPIEAHITGFRIHGRTVTLELDTDYAEERFFLKQTAAIHNEHVIAMPSVRLYEAE